MPLLVYIAGPYTHPDPVDNTRIAMEVADQIMNSGHAIPFIPHLTLFWHMHQPRPIAEWYAYDLEILGRCDALLRIPGASTGADAEVMFAMQRHIPVWDDLDTMLRALALDAELADVEPVT